jgi:hypothetical protein
MENLRLSRLPIIRSIVQSTVVITCHVILGVLLMLAVYGLQLLIQEVSGDGPLLIYGRWPLSYLFWLTDASILVVILIFGLLEVYQLLRDNMKAASREEARILSSSALPSVFKYIANKLSKRRLLSSAFYTFLLCAYVLLRASSDIVLVLFLFVMATGSLMDYFLIERRVRLGQYGTSFLELREIAAGLLREKKKGGGGGFSATDPEELAYSGAVSTSDMRRPDDPGRYARGSPELFKFFPAEVCRAHLRGGACRFPPLFSALAFRAISQDPSCGYRRFRQTSRLGLLRSCSMHRMGWTFGKTQAISERKIGRAD